MSPAFCLIPLAMAGKGGPASADTRASARRLPLESSLRSPRARGRRFGGRQPLRPRSAGHAAARARRGRDARSHELELTTTVRNLNVPDNLSSAPSCGLMASDLAALLCGTTPHVECGRGAGVARGVLVGGMEAAEDADWLIRHGVTHVVSVGCPASVPTGAINPAHLLAVRLLDLPEENLLAILPTVLRFLRAAQRASGTVLVRVHVPKATCCAP